MKTMAAFVVALLIGLPLAAQQPAEQVQAVVKPYLEIQAALANDRPEGAKAPAAALVKAARAMGKTGDGVAGPAATLEAAADIKAAREAFGPLSDAVIALVQAHGSPETAADVRLAYCPMAKRSWLQREAQVRNPYYGSSMATCGEIKPLKK